MGAGCPQDQCPVFQGEEQAKRSCALTYCYVTYLYIPFQYHFPYELSQNIGST